MVVDLLIERGTVVTPTGVAKTDVAIKDGRIMALGSKWAFPKAERAIDAQGKIVIPGGIDPHTHFEHQRTKIRPPENWDTASIASAIGGTTTTIDFALQTKGKSLLDAVKAQLSRAKELSAIDYTTKAYPLLTEPSDFDQVLNGMEEVVDYGITSFKVSLIYRESGRYVNDWQLYLILKRAKELGAMVTIHAENCFIGEENQAKLIKAGKTDPKYHAFAKPNLAEELEIQKCMMLAEATEAWTYIVHVSTRRGPDIIASYGQKGLPVFCETCTHYLTLTDDVFEPKFPRGILYVCSPPLRKQEDIEALWESIKHGRVHVVGSDHVAYTIKQKEDSCTTFKDIPNGIAGCEVRVPIVFDEGVRRRGLSLERFVQVVSTNVARIFGIYPQKGVIAPGSDADIVIIDPDKKHSLNAADLHMGTDLSPFEGMEVTGWPVVTILRGKVIVENDEFIGELGEGQFVKGKLDNSLLDVLEHIDVFKQK
jgi:dihydropyrimidinase